MSYAENIAIKNTVMKNLRIGLILVLLSIINYPLSVCSAQQGFRNPIIPGFNPDPSICRVGDDFYLVTSSFEYFPGLPIYHSRDLVNWRQIGHCLTRDSQLPLQKAASSGGLYAPSLRWRDGVFYVICTNVSEGGNFYCTATDPAGPWSDPIHVAIGDILGRRRENIFHQSGRRRHLRHPDRYRNGQADRTHDQGVERNGRPPSRSTAHVQKGRILLSDDRRRRHRIRPRRDHRT